MNKEQYKAQKTKGKPTPIWDVAVTLRNIFSGGNKVVEPATKEKVVPFSYKWSKIKEQYTGKTTQMQGGYGVAEKRSDRPAKYQKSGRYYHKPWPFTRKVVENTARPVDNLKWGIK